MSLTDTQLNELLEIAKQAALAAGEIIGKHQGSTLDTELKEGGTSLASKILTKVDNEAENAILNILIPSLDAFNLGLLSEETTDDKSRFEKDYFWCIDPLDGTLPFTRNQPGYSTSIALVSKAGEAVIGVVFDPRNDNLYTAIKGMGAFKNELPFKVATGKEDVTTIGNPGGAVMQAIYTIEQAPAIFFKKPKDQEGGGCLWDYAASSVIHAEAGGVNSDYSFKSINLNASKTVFMNSVGVIFTAGLTDKEVKSLLGKSDTIL